MISYVLSFFLQMLTNIIKMVTGLGTTKMVLVVRTDLKMSPGKIAAQCAHSAIILYKSAMESSNTPLKSWLYSGQPKIVLKVDKDCESALRALYQMAKQDNLNACLVYDAGKTQIDKGTLTVLGIGPNKTEEIDKLTKNLKLL